MGFNSIKKTFTAGYAGALDYAVQPFVVSAPIALSASQEYTPGKVLVRDGADIRPTDVGDVLSYHNYVGFGVLDGTKQAQDSGTMYADGDVVGILKFGVMKVVAGGNVVAGQAVVCQVNGGALTSLSHTGSLSTGQYRIPGAEWLDNASSGAVTRIFVNSAGGALSFGPVGVSGSNI
jgi:hypothetical protein